jgi:hypothetical protein
MRFSGPALLDGLGYIGDSSFVQERIRWREIGGGEELAEGVFGADGRWSAIKSFERPGDVEGRVVPEDGALSFGKVEIGGLVKDFGGVRENKEAVREAFGDPEELQVVVRGLGFEMESGPLAEVRGVAAEVDRDVPDVAGEDADEFALGLAELIVKAAKDPFDGERLVVLDELCGETGGLKG